MQYPRSGGMELKAVRALLEITVTAPRGLFTKTNTIPCLHTLVINHRHCPSHEKAVQPSTRICVTSRDVKIKG